MYMVISKTVTHGLPVRPGPLLLSVSQIRLLCSFVLVDWGSLPYLYAFTFAIVTALRHAWLVIWASAVIIGDCEIRLLVVFCGRGLGMIRLLISIRFSLEDLLFLLCAVRVLSVCEAFFLVCVCSHI